MRTIKTIILTVLVLSFAGEVMAGGYAVSSVGIRALSMGGAFRAIADDWSAAFYNPAGLAGLKENQLTLGSDFYNNRPEFTPNVTKNGYSFGYDDYQKRVPKDQIAYTPYTSGAIMLPLFKNVAVGLAVFEPYDYISEWSVYHISPTYNRLIDSVHTLPQTEKLIIFPKWSHRMNLDVIDFHPTIAAELIENKLSAGLGISIRKGSFLHDQTVLIPNTLPERFSSRPFDYLVQLSELDAAGWGFGLNLGLLYKACDKITVGASYQTKTKINLKGRAITKFYAPFNRYFVVTADTNEIAKELYTGKMYAAEHKIEADWNLPGEFGFGVSYKISDKVKAAADFVYTFWSDYTDIEMTVKSSLGLTQWAYINGLLVPSKIVNRWDDAFRLSVGVEGRLSERYALRGGYSFDQSPIPDGNATVTFNDPADKHHLSGGASLFFGKVELAGAAEIVITPEKTISSLNDYNNDGVFDNLSGTYRNTLFITSLGITVRF